MNTSGIIIVIVVAILIIALIAAIARVGLGRRRLRERFGEEYDRVVDEKGGRSAAEAELRGRERRHAALQLRELTPEQREAYRSEWAAAQARFIDDPSAAVHAVDELVARIVADRGYPAVDYHDRLSHLSVEHAPALAHYRAAHDASVRNDSGEATTEELRQAMVDYRATINHLLGDDSLPVAAPGGSGPDWTGSELTEEDERVLTPSEQPEADKAPRGQDD